MPTYFDSVDAHFHNCQNCHYDFVCTKCIESFPEIVEESEEDGPFEAFFCTKECYHEYVLGFFG